MKLNFLRIGILWSLLTACVSPGTTSANSGEPRTEAATPAPDSPIQSQFNWVMSVLNERQGVTTKAEIEERFHPTFLSQLPADKILAVFQQLHQQLGQLTLDAMDPVTAPAPGVQSVIGHVTSMAGKFRIILSLDSATGQIIGLLVQPDGAPPKVPQSLNEAEDMLKTLAPDASVLIAEVKNETCLPKYERRSTEPKAIGSGFKLYLLLALMEEISKGRTSWDTLLAIKDEWKSLPSGTMQVEKAGTEFTLKHYAEQMISISDNTATDHLLHTLGRVKIEAAVAASGHHKPELNRPFLSTRESFLLKLKSPHLETWLKLNASERRNYLNQVLADAPLNITLTEISSWKEPRAIDTVEWFASSHDICKTMATLLGRSTASVSLKPAMDIISRNPGVPTLKKHFTFVGFKGGSEPGVLNLNWLLQRQDGRWFVTSFTANNKSKALDENALIGVASGIAEQAGTLP